MNHFFITGKKKGFTLVELIIVIAIIGILAAISIIAYNGVQATGRDKSIQSDLDAVAAEITRYSTENSGVYGAAVAWYSGGSANANIDFTPSPGNIIDVVASTNDYCIRGYNAASNYKTVSTAAIEESTVGSCIGLQPSVAAGGNGRNDLVGWWKFNNASLDSSEYANMGTPNASVVPAVGEDGISKTAYAFNGTSAQVTVPDSTTLSPTVALSLSAWINIGTPTGAIMGIITKDISSGFSNAVYELSISSPTIAPTFRIVNSSDVSSSFACAGTTLSTGVWYHLVATYDGSTMRQYINGVTCSNTATATNIGDSTGNLRFGQQKNGSGRWFNGTIDDVRVYSRAMTAAEVTRLYQGGAQ